MAWLVVTLATGGGIVGVGERVTGGVRDHAARIALLSDLGEALVVGDGPCNGAPIRRRMLATPHDHRHPGTARTSALSAGEMGFRDGVGKANGPRLSVEVGDIAPLTARVRASR